MYTTIHDGVQDRINELHADAARQRLANEGRETERAARPSRLATFVSALRSTVTGSDQAAVLPKLSDYPHRS